MGRIRKKVPTVSPAKVSGMTIKELQSGLRWQVIVHTDNELQEYVNLLKHALIS